MCFDAIINILSSGHTYGTDLDRTVLRLGGLLFSPHLLLGVCNAEQLAVGVFLVGAAELQRSAKICKA